MLRKLKKLLIRRRKNRQGPRSSKSKSESTKNWAPIFWPSSKTKKCRIRSLLRLQSHSVGGSTILSDRSISNQLSLLDHLRRQLSRREMRNSQLWSRNSRMRRKKYPTHWAKRLWRVWKRLNTKSTIIIKRQLKIRLRLKIRTQKLTKKWSRAKNSAPKGMRWKELWGSQTS